jgi:hypothetical protein
MFNMGKVQVCLYTNKVKPWQKRDKRPSDKRIAEGEKALRNGRSSDLPAQLDS